MYVLADARLALWTPRKSPPPGFTALATLTLALGIGSVTAMFKFRLEHSGYVDSDRADSGDPNPMERAFWLQARLKPGMSLEQAQAQLNVIATRLAVLYPTRYPKKFTIKVLTIIDSVGGEVSRRTLHIVRRCGPPIADCLLQDSKHVVIARHRPRKRNFGAGRVRGDTISTST